MSSKTEKPTAERSRRAIREGDVPYSPMLVRTSALLAAATALPWAASAAKSRFLDRFHAALRGSSPDVAGALNDVATLVVPLLAVAAAGAALAGLVQTRGVVALGTARRHGIEGGRKRLGILDGRRAMRAATGGVVLATIVLSAVVVLRAFAPDVAATMSRSERALGFSGTLLEKLGWWIAALLVSGCIVELLFEHATWLSRLRMTPREVKEERREREGDPDVRRARRRAHEALLRSAPPSRDV